MWLGDLDSEPDSRRRSKTLALQRLFATAVVVSRQCGPSVWTTQAQLRRSHIPQSLALDGLWRHCRRCPGAAPATPPRPRLRPGPRARPLSSANVLYGGAGQATQFPEASSRAWSDDVAKINLLARIFGDGAAAFRARQLDRAAEIVSKHRDAIARIAEAAGMSVALLTSKTPKAERGQILARLASGEIDLLIGTHALTCISFQFGRTSTQRWPQTSQRSLGPNAGTGTSPG